MNDDHTPHMMQMQQLQGSSPVYGKGEFRKLQDIIDKQADRILDMEKALTLLWKETVESGNSTSNDYGWPKAREATLAALAPEQDK